MRVTPFLTQKGENTVRFPLRKKGGLNSIEALHFHFMFSIKNTCRTTQVCTLSCKDDVFVHKGSVRTDSWSGDVPYLPTVSVNRKRDLPESRR